MIVLLTRENLVAVLALIMVILIAQSRVRVKIHTLWEVVVGGLLGVIATLLCFQIFYQFFY